MKQAIALIGALVMFGAGCSGMSGIVPGSSKLNFGESVNIKIGESAMYADGLTVKLKEVNDSRCPKDVVCIWQGELSANFELKGGEVGSETEELRMGTVSAKERTQHNYTFTLESATTSSARINVKTSNQ